MKLIIVIMTTFLVQVSASTLAQQLTLRDNHISLKEVFQQIRKQTGYTVLGKSDLIGKAKPISLDLYQVPLEDALRQILAGQNLEYTIKNKAIFISEKEEPSFLDRVVDAFTPPIDVRGTVVDEKGIPLSGANVKVKGFKQAAVTDNEGRFYLPGVDDKAVLIVSFVGYKDVEVGVKASLSVVLELKSAELNEVVVAYGKTTQQALTGAVTVVKGEQIQNLPNRSFDKSLQGLVPGLLVTSGNGQPGGPASNFILRGIATGGQPRNGETFRNPLIIVDGVPVLQEPAGVVNTTNRITNPLAQLNPSDIETISVLKDAAAVALYGSQASNGVLLVTTKKGKAGKTVFNFRHQTEISSALEGKIDMLNQEEYLELLFESYKNTNSSYTDAHILADLRSKFPVIVKAPGDTIFYPQADWSRSMLNKNAVTVANEISMSGGNDKSNFYLNLEYTKQNGVAKNTGYDRKSMRFNYENRPTSWFKMGTNTTLSHNIQDYSNSGFNSFLAAIAISPLNPIRDINGNYIYQYLSGLGNPAIISPSPIAQSELDINNSTAYRGLSRLSSEIKILPNLSFNSSVGVDFMLNEAKEKNHPLVSIVKGVIQEQLFRTIGIINTNLLQYNKQWTNIHNLNILAGQEVRTQTSKYSFIKLMDISSNPDQDQLSGGNIIGTASGDISKQNLLSYFGQVSYGFKSKYYLSSSVRSDGSSRFGNNNRFGTFWSVGAGWVVSTEPFMKTASNWVNFLKLRGSMGPAGNSAAITDRLRFDRLSIINFLNGTVVFPSPANNPGNPSIQWEQTFTWDAGLELRALKDKISLTADIYTRKTKNLIAYDIKTSLGTGFYQLTGNIGDVKNQGVELSLSANIIQGKYLRWTLSGNWSRNRNLLTKSFQPEIDVAETNLVNKVGYEYNSFYLREWAGVNPDSGRPMWIDSLGKANEDYNAARRIIAGKAQPDGFGSIRNVFTYKEISLSIGIYYQYGSQILATSKLQNDGNASEDPYLNQSKSALSRWQKPGDIANNPRRLLNGQALSGNGTITDVGATASTRYLFDGDFIRLGNVGLNYNLPKQLVERLCLTSASLSLQVHNLATWTKYSGQDPENVNPSGVGGILYPQAKSYTVSLNVNF